MNNPYNTFEKELAAIQHMSEHSVRAAKQRFAARNKQQKQSKHN